MVADKQSSFTFMHRHLKKSDFFFSYWKEKYHISLKERNEVKIIAKVNAGI